MVKNSPASATSGAQNRSPADKCGVSAVVPATSKRENRGASSSPTSVIIVLGDIHGHAVLLDRFLDGAQRQGWIDGAGLLAADTRMVFMGDFIDRGTQSRRVIERVLALCEANPGRVHGLLGNHEMLALASLAVARELAHNGGGEDEYAWTPHGREGGWQLVREFGGLRDYVEAMRADAPIGGFLRSLDPALDLVCGDSRVLFVHAGIPRRIRHRADLDTEVEHLRALIRDEAALASPSFNVQQDPHTGENSLLGDRSIPRRRRIGVDHLPASLDVDIIIIGHTRHDRITRYGSSIYAVDVSGQPDLTALFLRAGQTPQVFGKGLAPGGKIHSP